MIEWANGVDSGIPQHEAYQYVFDSSMMLFALVLLNIVHPGRIMPGKECDFPSRKERKAVGKDNVKGRAGEIGAALPLHETPNPTSRSGNDKFNPTNLKSGTDTVSMGYVTEFPRDGSLA